MRRREEAAGENAAAPGSPEILAPPRGRRRNRPPVYNVRGFVRLRETIPIAIGRTVSDGARHRASGAPSPSWFTE
jgi:hypothetical protein